MCHLVAGGSAEDEDEAVGSLVEVEEPEDQSEVVAVVTWLLSSNHGSPDDVLRVGRVSQQADLPRHARPARRAPQPHLRGYVDMNIQGVPKGRLHFVFVIFSGSRADTEELFEAIE